MSADGSAAVRRAVRRAVRILGPIQRGPIKLGTNITPCERHTGCAAIASSANEGY
jgi:hypothetical protein